ncbi:MAG: ammonia-forming cytochrome c nitrite reductase subunit c552 [Phycisphaerae bacterium]|nr:ammonia-forming cytochrome c nitrite reductase subunit c552 [Phycisphaerae bacterium]
MTDEPTARGADNANAPLPKWAGLAIVVLTAVVVVLLLLLATSIMHRRWEAQRPALVAADIDEFESDNAVWGKNYEREYDAYKRQEASTVKTRYGGPFPRDYLDGDPNQVIIFAGYGFSKDYLQARGHIWAVEDISKTKRVKKPKKEGEKVFYPGTCWTCKSPDVPRKMAEFGRKQDPKETDPIKLIGLGAADFYASNWHDLKKDIKHPIGCLDCHDPKTMALRISRPALREGYQAVTGRSIETATHQEMRSLVCAQCHVEYYFKGKGKYLTFPWQKGDTFAKGTSVEKMIEYYDAPNFVDTRADDPDNAPLVDFVDFVHPISKTRIIKCQHPDYEMFATGVHHYRNVSCADCHMPYRSEGGMKVTDHHVQSPLLNISNSCAVCHRWSEAEIKARVETIQDKVAAGRLRAERAIARAHFDAAAAIQAKATDEELAPARKLIRHAQFKWDYVAANNGMGFHSPQESMRILANAIDDAQLARLALARLLGTKGITAEPKYPDISTREKTDVIRKAFIAGKGPDLLPQRSGPPGPPR